MDDVTRLYASRTARALVDGMVSVVLAGYLAHRGLSLGQVGAVVSGTLLGSAALTLAAGLAGDRYDRRRVLAAAAVLMGITGLGFAFADGVALLMLVGVVGTVNPSGGDVSLFLPTEQAVLAQAVPAAGRTAAFARYNVLGSIAVAFGALLGGLAIPAGARLGLAPMDAERAVFVIYSACALAVLGLYRGISQSAEVARAKDAAPLARSRPVVLRLAALFCLDSLGGGFVVQSLLVVWLRQRFGLPLETCGLVLFAAGLLSAGGQLCSAPLAARFGLVRTMVFTHLPANMFLALAGVVPDVRAAIACLLVRASLSSMDVPARQAYVMALVPPEERAAAASVTNVPRSLASGLPPMLVGWMLEQTSFGWPLVCAGALKAIYDLLLWREFAAVELPEER